MKAYKKPRTVGTNGSLGLAPAAAAAFAVGALAAMMGDDRIGQPRLKPLKKVKV